MKLKIKTLVLQEILSKAIKGCGNNKMLPITSLICLSLSDGTLTMQTTDSTNYMYAYAYNIEGENFYVVLEADKFSKLISKFTCEYTELSLDDRVLTIKGNGTYKIELPLDENGSLINFSNPLYDNDIRSSETLVNTISTADIKSVLNSNKSALSSELDVPCYSSYYIDENFVVSTDTYKICRNNISLLKEPTLISAETMNLLEVIDTGDITVYCCDNVIVFSSENVDLYTTKAEGIEDYQIDAISGLVDESFSNSCKVVKSTLLSALDRLSLFIGNYDKNSVTCTFDKDGIYISSKQSNAIEIINYNESSGSLSTNFVCDIDITMLQSQIKTNSGEFVNIHYGNDTAIKITDGNIVHIIALIED